jgi:hypothetical protein
MVRGLAAALALLMAGGAVSAQQPAAPAPAAPAPAPAAKPPLVQSPARKIAQDAGASTAVTPNAERTVTIGALNKRTGENRTFVGHPGQVFDFGTLHVTVRTCEVAPPWEQKLTGAFLLIDDRLQLGSAKRVFSGWMFAESPSLHPLEHPRYDIWVKSCTMRFPETGPNTVVVGRPSASAPAVPSSAKKSAETPSAEPN